MVDGTMETQLVCLHSTTIMATAITIMGSVRCLSESAHFDTQRRLKASVPEGRFFKENAEREYEMMSYGYLMQKVRGIKMRRQLDLYQRSLIPLV